VLLAVALPAEPLQIVVTPAAVIGIAALNVIQFSVDAAVETAILAIALIPVEDHCPNISRVIPK
jgi:hypothetical protein